MRIAFIVNGFPVISETFILDQITWLIAHECEVDIYTQRLWLQAASHPEVMALGLMDRAFALSPPPAPNESARIRRAVRDVARAFTRSPAVVLRALNPAWFGSDVLSFKPFYRALPFLAQRPYDVVHCHFGPNGILGVELRDLGALQAPIVTQFHGYDASSYVRERGEDVYRTLFAKGDQFLCVSERIQARLVEMGCDERKTRVHHTGVKVGQIPFISRVLNAGEAPRLLSVCRLVEKKGVEFGLRAVARLIKDHPNIEYTIIGEGPERAALTKLCHELGLDGHVKLLGAQTRDVVAAAMAKAHIFLAPSVRAKNGDEEGIPVVLMEALAAGLPAVSTLHAGIPELIAHGVSGMLAPERDAEAFADHISFLLSHPDERSAMAVAGRRTVERDYDVDQLNVQLLMRYREISGKI